MIKSKTTWENLPLNLTVRQAAEVMQCDPETIKRALRSKRLKGCKLGDTANCAWRIERGELLRFAKGEVGNARVVNDSCGKLTCVCTCD